MVGSNTNFACTREKHAQIKSIAPPKLHIYKTKQIKYNNDNNNYKESPWDICPIKSILLALKENLLDRIGLLMLVPYRYTTI